MAKILPWIPKDRLDTRFSRSSGPGGQGVNRTESKVEMRFHLESADWLSGYVRDRLKSLFSTSLNIEGELIISSQETRSQRDNYQLCLEKLSAMILSAMARPKRRIATKKTRSSQRRRLDSKTLHSSLKKTRGFKSGDSD